MQTSPIFLNKSQFKKLKVEIPRLIYINAFKPQLEELFLIDNHNYIGEDKEVIYKAPAYKKYIEKKNNSFQYVYYPWTNCVAKCVLKEDFNTLKTNRNKDLITESEQKKLAKYKVGVFGMSVGSNIAFVLTQSGISDSITLADFDVIDTTNLNRIMAGVHQIGLNKAEFASQRIYEANPYSVVNIMTEGINKANLEELLLNKKIDCIVDEVDDIRIKIELRILALKYKVPVLMITDNGDGVVLHIERYDLGHKKIFNNNLLYWIAKLSNKTKFSKEEAGDIIINNIVGGMKKVDTKMLLSVKRVLKKELVSWSQLGSSAILGGVTITIALKNIILQKDTRLNVRKYVNLDIL